MSSLVAKGTSDRMSPLLCVPIQYQALFNDGVTFALASKRGAQLSQRPSLESNRIRLSITVIVQRSLSDPNELLGSLPILILLLELSQNILVTSLIQCCIVLFDYRSNISRCIAAQLQNEAILIIYVSACVRCGSPNKFAKMGSSMQALPAHFTQICLALNSYFYCSYMQVFAS